MAEKKEKMTVHAGPVPRRSEDSFIPMVDVYEKDDGTTVLVAEVPGAKPESVDIRVDKGVLTVGAEAELPEPGDEYSRTFIGFTGGEYFRAFAISDDVDRDRIEASLADGVLTVSLPRAAAAKTRKIEIKEG